MELVGVVELLLHAELRLDIARNVKMIIARTWWEETGLGKVLASMSYVHRIDRLLSFLASSVC